MSCGSPLANMTSSSLRKTRIVTGCNIVSGNASPSCPRAVICRTLIASIDSSGNAGISSVGPSTAPMARPDSRALPLRDTLTVPSKNMELSNDVLTTVVVGGGPSDAMELSGANSGANPVFSCSLFNTKINRKTATIMRIPKLASQGMMRLCPGFLRRRFIVFAWMLDPCKNLKMSSSVSQTEVQFRLSSSPEHSKGRWKRRD